MHTLKIGLGPKVFFRQAPRFELLLFDHLDKSERARLSELESEPDLWGVARSRDDGALMALGRDTALLLLSLCRPGPLPAFAFRDVASEACEQRVLKLVLDGLLEVRIGDRFISGVEAFERLGVPLFDDIEDDVSRRALRYAAALDLDDPGILSWRLYCFNRIPRSAHWVRRLPDGEAVNTFLYLTPASRLRVQLERSWTAGEPREGWLTWQRRGFRRRVSLATGEMEPTWKLYVSPLPEALPTAFAALIEMLPSTTANSFKVGSDATGVLRPDKLVVYFGSFEDLAQGAELLAPALTGLPVHGVPFTSTITSNGALSWGVDPPRALQLSSQPPVSWRRWVVDRLAFALVQAQRETGGQPVWRFALERLRLEGVDVDSWTPSLALFNLSILSEA